MLVFFVSNQPLFVCLQGNFCNAHVHTDASYVFLFQKISYVACSHIFVFCLFLLQKDFDTLHEHIDDFLNKKKTF